MVRSIFG